MNTWKVTYRPGTDFVAERWTAESDNAMGTYARVYRREAKRGPKWAVYLRNSERMMSQHAIIWGEIVAAVESSEYA
jgi:hypothetical protein